MPAAPPIRPIAPLHRGQNRVDLARWGRRLVVVKTRRPEHRYRYAKEAEWFARARALDIPVPPLLAAIEDEWGLHLVLPPAPRIWRQWRPADWLARLTPLHRQPAPAGWGPLRADGRPRWSDRMAAASWYAKRVRKLLDQPDPVLARLDTYWATAEAGLIHGDVHRGNRVGRWIIDWEQVAVADPWEEAARAALASGWSETSWARAVGAHLADPRWIGAMTAAAVEAAATSGPRQPGAERWLRTT